MDMIEPAPDHSTFSRNRERLLDHDVAGEFFGAVVELARSEKLMSDEHFTVDGTRRSAIDNRTTRHAGYSVSQRVRKRVEEIFGWAKTIAGFRRTRFRGRARTQLAAYFVGAAYNLVRMARLLPLPEGA